MLHKSNLSTLLMDLSRLDRYGRMYVVVVHIIYMKIGDGKEFSMKRDRRDKSLKYIHSDIEIYRRGMLSEYGEVGVDLIRTC